MLTNHRIAGTLLTNTTTKTRAQIAELLSDSGMEVAADEVITAAVLTANYVRDRYPGAKCFLVNSGQIAEDMHGVDAVYPHEVTGCQPDTRNIVWRRIGTTTSR